MVWAAFGSLAWDFIAINSLRCKLKQDHLKMQANSSRLLLVRLARAYGQVGLGPCALIPDFAHHDAGRRAHRYYFRRLHFLQLHEHHVARLLQVLSFGSQPLVHACQLVLIIEHDILVFEILPPSAAGSSAPEFDVKMLEVVVCPLSKSPLRQASDAHMGVSLIESEHASMSVVH